MAAKKDFNENVSISIGSIYNKILKEREDEKIKKKEEKRLEKENRELEENNNEERPLSKKEKKEKSLEQWRDVIVNLTGDDLDYTPPKKRKDKYKKWIGEEDNVVGLSKDKPKKKKKTNYKKEFEHELNMLKNVVNEQNQWTNNLYRRFQNAVGPINKDAMPLNKTQVELAAAINTSRMNTLSMIKAIVDGKAKVADLEMKRKKLENDNNLPVDSDMGLQGADIIQKIMMSEGNKPSAFSPEPIINVNVNQSTNNAAITAHNQTDNQQFESFDPSTWGGVDELDPHIKYENIPKKTIVEYNQSENTFQYKTINTDTNEEIIDYPNPSYKLKGKDFDNMCVRDEYNNVYDMVIV